MPRPNVQKVDLPIRALITHALPRIDYADTYRMQLPDGAPQELDTIARIGLGTAPRWITLLMQLRNRIAGAIGLKTSGQLAARDTGHATLRVGDRLGIFRVFDRTDDELLLGENDRHLDFRVSVLVRNDGTASWVIVSTIVRFNNGLGRAYFLPVRPFHKLIVPAMLRSAYQRYTFKQL